MSVWRNLGCTFERPCHVIVFWLGEGWMDGWIERRKEYWSEFLEIEWPVVQYKLRRIPKEKISILWGHSYYLQYSLVLIFKGKAEPFLWGGAYFLTHWKGKSWWKITFPWCSQGSPVALVAFPEGQGASSPEAGWSWAAGRSWALTPTDTSYGAFIPRK